MPISALICGLKGAGSALGSPKGLSAAPRTDGASIITASVVNPATATTAQQLRMDVPLARSFLGPKFRLGDDALNRRIGVRLRSFAHRLERRHPVVLAPGFWLPKTCIIRLGVRISERTFYAIFCGALCSHGRASQCSRPTGRRRDCCHL